LSVLCFGAAIAWFQTERRLIVAQA